MRGILLKILMCLKDRIGEGERDGERNSILESENINLSRILIKVIKLTLSISTKKVLIENLNQSLQFKSRNFLWHFLFNFLTIFLPPWYLRQHRVIYLCTQRQPKDRRTITEKDKTHHSVTKDSKKRSRRWRIKWTRA